MGLFDRFRKSQPIKEVTYSSPEMAGLSRRALVNRHRTVTTFGHTSPGIRRSNLCPNRTREMASSDKGFPRLMWAGSIPDTS